MQKNHKTPKKVVLPTDHQTTIADYRVGRVSDSKQPKIMWFVNFDPLIQTIFKRIQYCERHLFVDMPLAMLR